MLTPSIVLFASGTWELFHHLLQLCTDSIKPPLELVVSDAWLIWPLLKYFAIRGLVTLNMGKSDVAARITVAFKATR